MHKRRRRMGIPPRDWSQAERDRLDAALGRKGRMQKKGPANGWSPATLPTVLSPYGLALAWLQDEGLLDWSLSPAARWPEPIIERYDAYLEAHYPKGTHQNRLRGLERAICILEPEADRRLFHNAINRLGKVHPSVDKERRAQSSIDLEDLGDDMMDSADAGEQRSPRLCAAHYRSGLQIGVLAAMMNRRGEFRLLECDVHVFPEGGRWYMKAGKPNSSTKRHPRKRRIPERLSKRFDRYVSVYREMLCCDRKGVRRYTGKALWISTRCRQQSANSISENICKFTKERFGEPVNVHAFRYSGVTTVAIFAPEQMHAVQVVVGHAPGSRTTNDNYNKASSYSASLEWNSIAKEIRERGLLRHRLGRRRQR